MSGETPSQKQLSAYERQLESEQSRNSNHVEDPYFNRSFNDPDETNNNAGVTSQYKQGVTLVHSMPRRTNHRAVPYKSATKEQEIIIPELGRFILIKPTDIPSSYLQLGSEDLEQHFMPGWNRTEISRRNIFNNYIHDPPNNIQIETNATVLPRTQNYIIMNQEVPELLRYLTALNRGGKKHKNCAKKTLKNRSIKNKTKK